jgi:proline iminopeptidase
MRTDLFPAIEPNRTGMLTVDGLHTLYWEESGNPTGCPVVFLHGGPGAGTSPTHRRFFDPSFYRIILVDQRGAGRSTPPAETRDNTLPHLIEDLEILRRHLKVENWLVFGGSWGATLALAYGQAHPERCLGFILRGIFLGRMSEVHWFMQGIRNTFPEAWRDFMEFLPPAERDDPLTSYHRRLTHPDPAIHLPAARAWSRYEGRCSTLLPGPDAQAAELGAAALSISRLEAHYFVNKVFLAEDQLLTNVGRLRRHPCTIVQGRYDMVCPAVSADELARAWPEARYLVVPDAGHAALEPGIRASLVAATEQFRLTHGASFMTGAVV